MSVESKQQPRSGRRRSHQTRRRVVIVDGLARVVITLGGIGTIIAVSLVCVYLVWVAIPLFLPESVTLDSEQKVKQPAKSTRPIHLASDEYLNMSWIATDDGAIRTIRADTGEVLSTESPFDGERPRAWSFGLRDGLVAFALDGGFVRLGSIQFETSFLLNEKLPPDIEGLEAGEVTSFRSGIVARTPEGQLRFQNLQIDLEDPLKIETDSQIKLLDYSISPSRASILATYADDGVLRIARVSKRENLLTGEIKTKLTEGKIPVHLPNDAPPDYLLLSGLGDNVYLVWKDGSLQRFDARNGTQPVLAETIDLVPESGESLTSLTFLIGKTSIVAGDSLGRVRVWFRIKPDDADTVDGSLLVRGHALQRGPAAVTHLAPSPRSRMLSVAYADESTALFHVTSEQELASTRLPGSGEEIRELTISPKDDALLALTNSEVLVWEIDAPHPEVNWTSMFRPIWYEGFESEKHDWQSSSGADDFEEKYGLMPLIFGTIKATIYAMLFGAPLALLAAIYSSEFLHPRAKSRIKPTIEIMASLPSVVLGFLAAFVLAPFVENVVPEFLSAFVTIPFTYLFCAYLWQLFPTELAVSARRYRMLGMVIALPLGVLLALPVGRLAESVLFAGDTIAWLDGQIGTGAGAWMFVLLPLSALAVVFLVNTYVTPRCRTFASEWSRTKFALLDFGKFLLGSSATLILAYVLSLILANIGWDPRGSYVGTYIQRNALIVGFAMGFAIIPIIYTISDDALSAVPDSLRAASLGAGATQWQTAIRVIIPTAMSGLFSAMMVGLGRAVGETMIVLMAAGNTPLMEWNMFNGFRTLSANIATELPEAVQFSTHYRMLFLTALLLFAMTFVVNTAAELVRLRFRKRAFQL